MSCCKYCGESTNVVRDEYQCGGWFWGEDYCYHMKCKIEHSLWNKLKKLIEWFRDSRI